MHASKARTSAASSTSYLYCDGAPTLLFTDNETNTERLFGQPNATPFVKDGINDCVVHGQRDAVNSDQTGTKAAAQYVLTVGAGESHTLRLRLSDLEPAAWNRLGEGGGGFGPEFGELMRTRRQEADEFYASVTPSSMSADAANVMRQALAGM